MCVIHPCMNHALILLCVPLHTLKNKWHTLSLNVCLLFYFKLHCSSLHGKVPSVSRSHVTFTLKSQGCFVAAGYIKQHLRCEAQCQIKPLGAYKSHRNQTEITQESHRNHTEITQKSHCPIHKGEWKLSINATHGIRTVNETLAPQQSGHLVC